MTESGKTSLAVQLSYRFETRGVPRIILDPMNDPRWRPVPEVDWQGWNVDEFKKLWKQNQQCALFLDEGGKSIGKYAPEMAEVVTMARHWGHETHIIGQRPQQMDATIREQLSEVYLFRCSPLVAKIFAEEFAQREILLSTELQRGEFIIAKRFEKPVKCRIEYATGAVSFV